MADPAVRYVRIGKGKIGQIVEHRREVRREKGKGKEENSFCGRGLVPKRELISSPRLDLNSKRGSVSKALHAGGGNGFGSRARIKLGGGAAGA